MTSAEEFKPIPIRRAEGLFGHLTFALRNIVDLQLLTCVRFLKPRLALLNGAVLDVGCGEMPFRGFLPVGTQYTGLDIPTAGDFGMRWRQEVVAFDGIHIPFPDGHFNHVICTEVLEHADDPVALIDEMQRVLAVGGTVIVTVPFSARVHHAPHDHHRFTRYRLERMFSGMDDIEIVERGDDLAVIANKLIVVCMRLIRPGIGLVWRLPLLMLAAPATLLALALAHLSLWFEWGSKADPLGYGLRARKT